MDPINYSDIQRAIRRSGLQPDDYELNFTGKGYVIHFADHPDSYLFAIGLAHTLGSTSEALEAFKSFPIERLLYGGVKITLVGSVVGF
jgi:hypothetical protein